MANWTKKILRALTSVAMVSVDTNVDIVAATATVRDTVTIDALLYHQYLNHELVS